MELDKKEWERQLSDFVKTRDEKEWRWFKFMLTVCFIVSMIQACVWVLFFVLGFMLT